MYPCEKLVQSMHILFAIAMQDVESSGMSEPFARSQGNGKQEAWFFCLIYDQYNYSRSHCL